MADEESRAAIPRGDGLAGGGANRWARGGRGSASLAEAWLRGAECCVRGKVPARSMGCDRRALLCRQKPLLDWTARRHAPHQRDVRGKAYDREPWPLAAS